MKDYWFKAKEYGWGWQPASWQGWIIVFMYVLFVVGSFFQIDRTAHSASDTLLNFIPRVVVFSLVLIAVCYKTGEKKS